MKTFSIGVCWLAVFSLPATGDEVKTGPLGHSIHGEAFDEGPRQRAQLLSGMGEVSFPVTTGSKEAQAFFNQGVGQLHTFYYYEAERSFRQVALLDPGCAMAYWGMAMANWNNHGRARQFLKKAEEKADAATDRERKYLEALGAYLKEGVKDPERRDGYVKGLESVVLTHPDDLEAKAFLALALIQSGWAEKFQSRVSINNLLLEVLQRSPLHPGAHHYRIHLWDNANFDAALDSALAYGRSSPGIAHAWHMPGHIYNGLSRWKEAAYQQEASARVDHAHLFRQGILPFEIHNYAHNQHYLIANLNHLGRAQDAIDFSRNLIETPRDPQKNDRSGGQRLGRTSLLRIYTRYERWVDLLTDPLLDWSDAPIEEAWQAYGRGLAQLGLGLREKAAAEGAKLEKIAAKAAKSPGYEADLIETARLELQGKLLVAEGKLLEGFDLLHRGAKLQVDKFAGDLAGYPRRFHEILGQVHLAVGDFPLAEACFREALNRRKNMVVSLAGLSEACFRAGKHQEAAEAYRLYAAASRDADHGLACEKGLQGIPESLATLGFDLRSPPPGGALLAGVGGSPGPGPSAQSHAAEAAPTVELESLGPRLWAPSPAPDFTVEDSAGNKVRLSDYRGKEVLVLFYLGAGCAACMEQVTAVGKEKEEFKKLGVQVLALSDDPPEKNRELLSGSQKDTLPPLFTDPGRQAARLYGAQDTFEDLPLHGTVLIDAQGKLRWARIGAQPFKDTAFLRAEAARIHALVGPRPKRVLGL